MNRCAKHESEYVINEAPSLFVLLPSPYVTNCYFLHINTMSTLLVLNLQTDFFNIGCHPQSQDYRSEMLTYKESPHSTVMETASAEERIFDFFKLPRKLRDAIYNKLGVEIELASGWDDEGRSKSFGVKMKKGPSAKLLLVSHQFKTEYEQQVRRKPTIIFRDFGGSSSAMPKLDMDLSNFARAEMHLVALGSCQDDLCNVIEDIDLHKKWTSEIWRTQKWIDRRWAAGRCG